MDLSVVDDNGGVNGNSTVGVKRTEAGVNISLSPAFDSQFKAKQQNSSNESVYELIEESAKEDSDNEVFNSDSETDLHKNINSKLNSSKLKASKSLSCNGSQDSLELTEMDEMFVIIDDDANDASDEKNDCKEESSEAKGNLDCNNMDEMIKEFAVEVDKSSPRLSDNEDKAKSAVKENAVIKTKDEEKSDSHVILSSDDDAIDDLLDEFAEENSLGENSASTKGSTDAVSATSSSVQLKPSASNDFTVLKSSAGDQSSDTINTINSSHSNLQKTYKESSTLENSTKSRTSSAIKNESACEIVTVTDEKSNDSNNSSILILDDDDDNNNVKEDSENKASKEILQTSFPKLNSPLNSPSFSSSSEEKFEFDSIILDIVDETSHEKENKGDNLHLDSKAKEFPLLTDSSCNKLDSLLTHASDSLETESNVDSAHTNKDIDLNEPSFDKDAPTKNASSESTPSSAGKVSYNSIEKSDLFDNFLNCNGNVSSNSNLSSSNLEKDKQSDSESQDVSNDFTATKVTETANQGKIELITSTDHDSSKDATCNEDKSCNDSQKSQDIESLIVKSDVTCNVANTEELKMDSKYEAGDKIKSEAKKNIQGEKTKDDITAGEEQKMVCKCENDDKMKLEVANEKVDDSVIEKKEKILDTDDESKADAEMKVNVSIKTEISTERDKERFVEHDSFPKEVHQFEDSLNKRKLEDDNDDKDVKKLKCESKDVEDKKMLNSDSSSVPSSDSTLNDTKVKDLKPDIDEIETKDSDEINPFSMPLSELNKKIRVSKSTLDTIALQIIVNADRDEYKNAMNVVKLLEEKKKSLNDMIEELKIGEFRDAQRNMFSQNNFRAKVPTRTVGVNVKIYRESEIKHAMSLQKAKNAGKNSVLTDNNTLPDNKSLVPKSPSKDTVISPAVSSQQIVKKVPRIITPATPRPPQVMALSTRIPAPNVTVSGNRLFSVGRPNTSSVVLVPSSTMTSPSTSRFVDIGKKEEIQKSVPTGISNTAGKVNVPGMASNPNVLVPLKEYLQLLPAGTKCPVTRPNFIPPLPSSLVGARTVTYLVPQNSALGARGIQNFLPAQNQQVQFVLRVTNPGTASTLNSIVNTVARPAIMQPPLATAPRLQPPMVTSNPVQQPQTPPSNSGLILISHTSKHPAPFPKSPHYPDNKGKALPPKPALKGSKNQSGGIVLSWNMNLGRNVANISSYQLFAYQETDGPVDASLWKKVGDVNALPLPMACTLTQFVDKNRYYFTVRAVDVFQRFGPFSDPVSILFEKDGDPVKKEKGT